MKKILVTGGAGFIGSNIVKNLLSKNFSVVVLDDFSTGRKENLPENGNLKIIEGSILDKELVDDLTKNVDVVFHEAAIVSVKKCLENPDLGRQINVIGAQNVFEKSAKNNVEKVIYASSAAIYGGSVNLPLNEKEKPSPVSDYGWHKLQNEKDAEFFSKNSKTDFIGLRYFNVYGFGQNPESEYSGVISIFVKKIKEGGVVNIFGDGEQTRDFVFVEDVARANLLAMESSLHNEVINVAFGQSVSINKLVKILSEILQKEPEIKCQSVRKGDIKHSSADVSLAKEKIKFNPSTDLQMGLRKMLLN